METKRKPKTASELLKLPTINAVWTAAQNGNQTAFIRGLSSLVRSAQKLKAQEMLRKETEKR